MSLIALAKIDGPVAQYLQDWVLDCMKAHSEDLDFETMSDRLYSRNLWDMLPKELEIPEDEAIKQLMQWKTFWWIKENYRILAGDLWPERRVYPLATIAQLSDPSTEIDWNEWPSIYLSLDLSERILFVSGEGYGVFSLPVAQKHPRDFRHLFSPGL